MSSHLVRASVRTGCGGCLAFAYTPEQALRFAVLTRHRGLGLTLVLPSVGDGSLRCRRLLSLGGAEQLFCFTPEEMLPLRREKGWDFAQLSDRELIQSLENISEERYNFHKHAMRGTLTPELEKDRKLAEEWGEAACQEMGRRGL